MQPVAARCNSAVAVVVDLHVVRDVLPHTRRQRHEEDQQEAPDRSAGQSRKPTAIQTPNGKRSAMRVMLTLDLWANSSASSHLKARIRKADCSELTGARARRSAIGPSWDSLGICLGDSGFTAIRRFGRKQHGSSWFDVRAADAAGIRRLTRLKPMRICNSSIRNRLGGFWNAMNGLRRSTKCRNVWPEGEGTKQEPVARLGRLTP